MMLSFRRLLALNALVLAGAIVFGASLSERPPDGTFGHHGRPDATFWPTARHVFLRNLMVVALLVLGASTLGVVTVMTLAVNGYQLGFGFGVLLMASPARAMWVMTYLPLEFGALLLASTAATELSRQLFLSLLRGHEFRPAVSAKALSAAVCMLAVAAALEAVAARAIAGM